MVRRWWEDLDTVIATALPARSRILDVGCGDGEFVARLAERGFDAAGIDPRAPARPRLIKGRVEDATALGEFDAVTTVMALHHAELDTVVPAIARLLRPQGWLFVYELAWDAYDERAAGWLARHDPSVTGTSLGEWWQEHRELHTSQVVIHKLAGSFDSILEIRRPFLARMLGRHDLEAEELALIDAQLLPALGVRYIGRPITPARARA